MRAILPLAVLATCTVAALPDVTRIDVESRTDVLNGKPWGNVGAYEKLTGKVYFALDPRNPHNRIIPNIDKAPRNAEGQVEFSADIVILTPKDRAKGNGVAFFEVPNRGHRSLLAVFCLGGRGAVDDTQEAYYGDGSLLNAGYTLVWVGWQYSVAHAGDLIGVDLPLATENGHPATGRVSTFGIGPPWIINNPGPTLKFDPDMARYTPVDLNDPTAALTVAQSIYDKPHPIPRDQWQFAKLVDGKVVPDATSLYMKSGFLAGLRYDLSYTAASTAVAGLGYAAQRDVASAFKYRKDLPVAVQYAYTIGISQTGRFLREFIYDGFNADEHGRKSFDLIWAQISGAARGDFVQPFSLPDGLGIFTGTMYPFADTAMRDPQTGKTDSMLMRTSKEAMPKIVYSNSETEYVGGGRVAALIHTSLDGKSDAQVPDNVRIYMWASSSHGAAPFPPSKGIAQQMANPNNYYWAMRAIFPTLDTWVRKGEPPTPSRYPHLADTTLVLRSGLKFPAIPGVQSPSNIPGPYRADLGGPLTAPSLPDLVPNVDSDGNDAGGIRLPEIAVPLATYTGWSFRSLDHGAPTEIIPLTGSFIPFPLTRADRLKTGDPRLSIEERYPSREIYLSRVRHEAEKLVQQRYLLSQDVDPIVAHAQTVWDYLTTQMH